MHAATLANVQATAGTTARSKTSVAAAKGVPAIRTSAKSSICAVETQTRSVACSATLKPKEKTNARGIPDAPRVGQWTAVVTSAEWLFNDLQNETFAEQLRERVRYYDERGWDRDFYIVPNPSWLSRFPDVDKRCRKPSVAIVSSDEAWIIFMKLRLDRCARVELGNDKKEALSSSDMSLPEYNGNESDASRAVPYSRYQSGWWKKFYPTA